MSKSVVSQYVYLDTNCAWPENRSAAVQCCSAACCMQLHTSLLPHSHIHNVAALECSQVKQELHNKPTNRLTVSLPLSLSLAVSLLLPFCMHFHIENENHSSGRPTTRGRVWHVRRVCVFYVAILILAKTKAESK